MAKSSNKQNQILILW